MEISFLVVSILITLIGFPIHYVLVKLPYIQKLKDRRNKIIKENSPSDTFSYNIIPQSDVLEHLGKITTRLSNNYRILIAVHGILLAFVISNTILLVFTSWYFVLWCGMILAVIVRSAKMSLKLSDVTETQSEEESKRAISSAKRFFNLALFILVLNIILLPSIYLLDEPNNIDQLQRNFHLNILGASLSLATSFSLFYYIAFTFKDLEYPHGGHYTIFIIFTIIILGTFFYSFSPTDIIPIQLTDELNVSLPLIVGALPIFGLLYTLAIAFKLITVLPMILPEKYRRIIIRVTG